jgi:hypothetical protein
MVKLDIVMWICDMVKVSNNTLTPFMTIPLYKNTQNEISDISLFIKV